MKRYDFFEMKLFSLEEIQGEFNSAGAKFGALRRLEEHGETRKLTPGLYACINPDTQDICANRFEIATALRPDGYCAFHTALEYHGLAEPAGNEVQIISLKQNNAVVADGTVYNTYTNVFHGGVEETACNSLIRVTDLERTIVDCLDRINLAGGLDEVCNAIAKAGKLDESRMLEYLNGYDRKFLYKKAGYLLSLANPAGLTDAFYDTCLRNSSKRADDIRRGDEPFIYDKTWCLYVPMYMHGEESVNNLH